MGFKMGIVGCGAFGQRFVELYSIHPLVDEMAVADLVPERADKLAEKFNIKNVYYSLDDMLKSDIDAIGIFTQRQLHGPMVIKALKAGKHVCCAVPMATSIDEIREIIDLVEEKKLIYMTNETSYYYPDAIFCREKFRKGEFGEFTTADSHYLHDMSEFYKPYMHSGGVNWKRIAGFPPMFYPTHSISMPLCVTGAHVTKVSCFGFRDYHEDNIFGETKNDFKNPFSNETALMRTSDGGCIRVNEYRRVVNHKNQNSVAMSFKGTNATYDSGTENTLFTVRGQETQDVTDLVSCKAHYFSKYEKRRVTEDGTQADFFSGVSKIHDTSRLPEEYRNASNGHYGSHQFLTDDFCRAVTENKLPPNDAWRAAAYCAPGLIAHESAMNDGILLDVPYFGEAPSYWERID